MKKQKCGRRQWWVQHISKISLQITQMANKWHKSAKLPWLGAVVCNGQRWERCDPKQRLSNLWGPGVLTPSSVWAAHSRHGAEEFNSALLREAQESSHQRSKVILSLWNSLEFHAQGDTQNKAENSPYFACRHPCLHALALHSLHEDFVRLNWET